MAISHQLVSGRTTLLLRALRAKQVTEARRAAHELALRGYLEPLGNGLLGLLHGERSKTEAAPPHGKGNLGSGSVGKTPPAATSVDPAGERCQPDRDVVDFLAYAAFRRLAGVSVEHDAEGQALTAGSSDITGEAVGVA